MIARVKGAEELSLYASILVSKSVLSLGHSVLFNLGHPTNRGSTMGKTRLEAFSDGVIAIIITIMVLEMKVPHGVELATLKPLIGVFLSYVLSFIYVGIYWNNHHHLMHTVSTVRSALLWANLHFLFWLSLLPFASGWVGENHFAAMPSALYGVVLLMAGFAYWVLQNVILATQGPDSALAKAIGKDRKGKLSLMLYMIGIAASFWNPWVSQAIYVLDALIWLIPDRRLEKALGHQAH
jgi:uncharacterized membrane protein